MKKITIVIISLMLLALPLGAQEIFKEDGNTYSTGELKLRISSTKIRKLIIKSARDLHGSIELRTLSTNEVNGTFFKKAITESKKKAFDYIDLITVSISYQNDIAIINLRCPNPAPWSGNDLGLVEMNLEIPELCEIEIDALYFDIKATGPFNSLIASESLGRYEVSNIKKQLTIHTSNRRLLVENITAAVNLSTSNSSLIAYDIISPHKSIRIRNEGGDIKMENITGELNVKNKYGRIMVTNFTPRGIKHHIRGANGPIIVSVTALFSGQLILSNQYEDIELITPPDISAEFALAVDEDGEIEVTDLFFKPELIQSNRLYLTTKDGAALINGSIRGKGNIYIRADQDEE